MKERYVQWFLSANNSLNLSFIGSMRDKFQVILWLYWLLLGCSISKKCIQCFSNQENCLVLGLNMKFIKAKDRWKEALHDWLQSFSLKAQVSWKARFIILLQILRNGQQIAPLWDDRFCVEIKWFQNWYIYILQFTFHSYFKLPPHCLHMFSVCHLKVIKY